MTVSVKDREFGKLPSGERVVAYTLQGPGGLVVEVMGVGACITRVLAPDRRGVRADVVLGFDNLADYLKPHPFFGVVPGRVTGRISHARFTLDGVAYSLAANESPHHLHGGKVGWDKKLWTSSVVRTASGEGVRFELLSPNGDEGYPGAVRAAVTYSVGDDNALVFETEVEALERPTPVNLAQHSYFNLAGEGSGSTEGHELQILADAYVPSDGVQALAPRLEPVVAGGNDLRRPRRLSDAIAGIHRRHGDQYLVRRDSPDELAQIARLTDPVSGRVMTVHTTEQYVQFYSGMGLDGSVVGRSGRAYGPFAGLCLECQGHPDGVNVPALGDIIHRPGKVVRQRTEYRFGVA